MFHGSAPLEMPKFLLEKPATANTEGSGGLGEGVAPFYGHL